MSTDNLRTLFQLVARRFGILDERCCETCCGQDINVSQSHILFEVSRQHNPSMRDVANSLGIDITTFSRQVKSLIDKGYILKTPHPDDQRVHLLSLTPKGEDMKRQIDDEMNRHIEHILSQLNESDRKTVTKSVELLNTAMQNTESFCC